MTISDNEKSNIMIVTDNVRSFDVVTGPKVKYTVVSVAKIHSIILSFLWFG